MIFEQHEAIRVLIRNSTGSSAHISAAATARATAATATTAATAKPCLAYSAPPRLGVESPSLQQSSSALLPTKAATT